MSDLVAVLFNDEATAFDMRAEVVRMQNEYLIELEDAVVVSKKDDGKVKLHQAANLTAAGAAGGSFWGLLLGALFFMPITGAAIGAGAGALSAALSDTGINDDFMKRVAEDFKPGTAAVFLLIRKMTTDKVIAKLSPFCGLGKLLQTSLSKDVEQSLRRSLE
jgi:uncharacterized membrane protein